MKERLFSSLYLARLGARVWVFVLTMISQLILSVCYLKSMYDLGMSTIGHSFLQLLYALLHIGGWSPCCGSCSLGQSEAGQSA